MYETRTRLEALPKMNIPFSPPDISMTEINEVIDTLKSGWITTGPKTKRFEQKLTEFCRTSKTVCLNSATAAMELTLRILGIGEGDEVITSAYTYTASASVIQHVGAKIVLVDTARDSFNIDPELLKKAITERTKAVIPVDIGGVMCDYESIHDIVNQRRSSFRPSNDIQHGYGRAIVMADAAHSLGATQKGRMSGEAADFTCFSFHAVKNLTTAEGGAVTWKDTHGLNHEELYRQYMLMSLHGQSKDALAKTRNGGWEYDINSLAYKCNMTDIMASIGLAQLGRYTDLLSRRKEIVRLYDKAFENSPVTFLKHEDADFSSSRHLYMVRLTGKNVAERNRVIEKMSSLGIATNVHFKPLPLHTAYRNMGFDIMDYPNALSMYENEITLPLHTLLTDDEVMYVAEELKGILDESF